MKLLIYGARGWIGQQFVDVLEKHSINYVVGNVHIEQLGSLKQEIEDVKPTHSIVLTI